LRPEGATRRFGSEPRSAHLHPIVRECRAHPDLPYSERYTGLGSDVSLPKAGKMPALPGKSARETKLFTLNRYNNLSFLGSSRINVKVNEWGAPLSPVSGERGLSPGLLHANPRRTGISRGDPWVPWARSRVRLRQLGYMNRTRRTFPIVFGVPCKKYPISRAYARPVCRSSSRTCSSSGRNSRGLS